MSGCPRPVTVDFETFGIEGRPDYPPKPVGVSIKPWGKKAVYWAWGHPSKNNCHPFKAIEALKAIWTGDLLFQNGKFDVDVAETHLGLKVPHWSKIHDTLFLLFLDDPHQQQLGLKPSAERLLGEPPEERDAVVDWLVLHQPVEGVKISAAPKSDHYAGRYIAYAPGDLVGKYANGDTRRTEDLFRLLWPKNHGRGMDEPYDRERRLMPVLLEMERQGVPVDLNRLTVDIDRLAAGLAKVNTWILKAIKAGPDLNLDSGAELVEAMVACGKADQGLMGLTPTGKVKTDKAALLDGVTDKTLLAMLKYRTQLGTCLRTFMKPWHETACRSRGLIYTNWNQVRGNDVGTRTGRLSSHPNFQNIPKQFKPIFCGEETDKAKAKLLPVCPIKDLSSLPMVRDYIIPFKGHVLVDRDYSQQELRILAHFEGGALTQAYLDDPWLDVHDHARTLINAMTGKAFERGPIKNTMFGLIYGMGVGLLAGMSGVTVEVAAEVKKAALAVFPGLKQINQDLKARAMANKPIRTWGGREYYCEPPKIVPGRGVMTFEYKMLNVLIQGSAADCTKEALIRYADLKAPRDKILLNVHDQLTVSVPKARKAKAMQELREAMESVTFEVPMLSEGKVSDETWFRLKPYDKKGKVV